MQAAQSVRVLKGKLHQKEILHRYWQGIFLFPVRSCEITLKIALVYFVFVSTLYKGPELKQSSLKMTQNIICAKNTRQ